MTRGSLVAVMVLLCMPLGCGADSETLAEVAAGGGAPQPYPPPTPPPESQALPKAGMLPTAVVVRRGAERPADPVDDVRDGRSSRTTPRALPLLLTEIQQLEALERASEL